MEEQTPSNQQDVMRLNSVVGKEVLSESLDGRTGTRPKFDRIDYPVQQESDIAGMGQPMSLPFLLSQIKEYNATNKKLYEDVDETMNALTERIDAMDGQGIDTVENQSIDELRSTLDILHRTRELVGSKEIAIDLGKEALLLILAQKECEGIRFYFCNSPYGNSSVAAVGIRTFRDEAGQTHQKPHPQDPDRLLTEAQDIGVKGFHQSILEDGATDDRSQVLNVEVGPPYRTRQLVSNNLVAEPEDLENDFIDSLRSVL